MDTKTFKSRLAQMLEHSFGKNIASAESHQLHDSIAKVVMEDISAQWKKSTEQHLAGRRAMYLSMEFLMGRAVYNNLL